MRRLSLECYPLLPEAESVPSLYIPHIRSDKPAVIVSHIKVPACLPQISFAQHSLVFVQIVYVSMCAIGYGDTFYLGLSGFDYTCPFSAIY